MNPNNKERVVPPEYDLISTTSPDSRITYANEHFTNIAGYSAEELEGNYHNIVRHPDMPKAAFQDMWKHLKDRRSWMGTVKNRCKNGDHYWVNAYVTPITNDKGEIFEYQSVRGTPSRDDIQRSEKYYAKLNQGKLPIALRLPNLSISFINNFLAFITLYALIYSVFVKPHWTVSLLGMSACLIQIIYSCWWGKKLSHISKTATQNFKTDITKILYTGRRDDLSSIEFALKMKSAELRAVVGRTGDTCNNILHQVEDDAANIKKITEVIDNQRRETEQLATAINEMSSSIKEVAYNAHASFELTEQAKDTAELGQSKIANAINAINSLHTELQSSKDTITDLVTSTSQIGNIINVIRNIAEQTNLLALNATIEAARAGEHGRGFAVVADEVRALATKTRCSTDEISQMIEMVQNSTHATVHKIEHGVGLSESCSKYASEAGDVFYQIRDMMAHVTDSSHQIETAVVEQSTVTEEINKNISNLNELASESTSGSHDALDRISVLVDNLEGLHRLIKHFKK